MSDALPLPPRPNLEQYKQLARDFQEACRFGASGAIREWAARWVAAITRLRGVEITPEVRRQVQQTSREMDRRWQKFRESEERASRCLLADVHFFLAREHGFASWPKFAKHVEGLARGNSAVSNFEAAADAIVAGDRAALERLLREHPGLVRGRSTREHHSTLLHYVSANGVENYRQKTPKNIVEITKLLLDAGAAVDAESDDYGGGCTALGLVATSVHPEGAGVQIELLQTLLDHGARLDGPSGGNGHSLVHACIANGQPGAAAFLAGKGAPVDLEGAAALGLTEVVRRFLDDGGASREGMESAVLYACGYGKTEVVELLLDRGVAPGVRNDDGQTGLHWAAYGPHVEVTRLLLARRAPIDVKDQRFHATALDVALWTWDSSREGARHERCYEVVAMLVRAGARLDRLHWTDPEGEKPGMLEKIDGDARMRAALAGG